MRSPNAKKNITPTVLVVEDDESIISLIKYNLEKADYNVIFTDDGDEALVMIKEQVPDVILLDWMLPGMSGVQICQHIRKDPSTKAIPVIMISARGEEGDRVEGLDRGADDYLVKPFSPKELLARINAVFRRIRPAFTSKTLEFNSMIMDLASHSVRVGERSAILSPVEYKLLQSFIEYPRRVLSREQILRCVWGPESDVEPRTVDVHINRLRNAMKKFVPEEIAFIRTIRAIGYSLCSANDPDPSMIVDDSDFEKNSKE